MKPEIVWLRAIATVDAAVDSQSSFGELTGFPRLLLTVCVREEQELPICR
jgi:hypothetical protein